MPKDSTPFFFDGFGAPRYTNVPDEVFDVIAPELKEGELRVLLYIIRRTFGFKKEADDIALSQMVNGIVTTDGRVLDRGTGMHKPAIMRSLQGLLGKGIIMRHRNTTKERGHEATTYSLRFKGDPWFPKVSKGGSLKYPSMALEENLQDTVFDNTDSPDTDNSNIRMATRPNYDADRRIIVQYIEDIAREFNDKAPLKSSVTRAYKCYKQSGKTIDSFIEHILQARAITKERSTTITSVDDDKRYPAKRKMGYFFAVLEKGDNRNGAD